MTDNWSVVAKITGYDANALVGPGSAANQPLQFPMVVSYAGGTYTAQSGLPVTVAS